jgi:hypothetical protein
MREVGIEAAHIVGHSFGGMIAQRQHVRTSRRAPRSSKSRAPRPSSRA